MEERESSTKAQKVKDDTSTSEGKTTGFIQQPEIVTIIILFIQAQDVCSLGCCAQVLHSVCNSDYAWKELYKRRWPQKFIILKELLESCLDAQSSGHASLPSAHSELPSFPTILQGIGAHTLLSSALSEIHSARGRVAGTLQGLGEDFREDEGIIKLNYADDTWICLKANTHMETTSKILGSLDFVDREITGKYLRFPKFLDAVNLLKSMELNFEDVCSVLFSTKLSVQANLIGLHFSVNFLRVNNKDVRDAVVSRGVAERRVLLKWFRKTMYFDLLRMPEQRCYLTCSIGKIAMDKEVLALLSRGPTTNIQRIRIGTLPDQGVKQTT